MSAVSWSEWSQHVLAELKRLSDNQDDINEKISKIAIEIALLKVKSGLWGLCGASIPILLALAIGILKDKL